MSCACSSGYHIRPALQPLPGNPRTVAIPIFENDTYQERAAPVLTDALSRILQQRANCKIVDKKEDPDALFIGRVTMFVMDPTNVNASPVPGGLPKDAVLVQEYALRFTVQLSLQDKRTGKFVWSKTIGRSENVPASAIQLEAEGAALNPVIDASRARINLKLMADRWAEDTLNDIISHF